MDVPLDQVIIPSSFTELFSAWNRFQDAVLYAGGTNIFTKQKNSSVSQPPVFISLDKISELQRITRTEHSLDIGSMVTLNKLIELGKTVPGVLHDCVKNIAGVQLRNIATIGGNICSPQSYYPDTPAAFIALDAQYELRNANISRWVSASRFHTPQENTSLGKQELLTRIRLPLHQWDYAVYKKFQGEDYLNASAYSEVSRAALLFLAKTQKNILSEIRVIIKTGSIVRNKPYEDLLNGKSLPLSRKTADDFIENWKDFFRLKRDEPNITKNTLINYIQENIYNLSE